MRVLIIGAGAVGSFVGARLGLAGHEVTLVGRPGLAEAVRAGGLTLIEPSGSRRTASAHVVENIAAAFANSASTSTFASTSTLTSAPPYDFALVTVKAYDTAGVIAELKASAVLPPPLLTLQNGVGNEEALAEAFGAERILSGAIDTPVSLLAPGLVQVNRPRFRAGLAPVGRAAPVIDAGRLLRDAGFGVDVFGDYRRLKWSKLLLNLLANAQCAILDWTPAQVMADPAAARLEALAWQEAFVVMAGLGVRPVALAGYPLPLLAPLVGRLPPAWLARGLRSFVAGGRGSKMPSLHVALSAGKPSEVGWLNGAMAEHAIRLDRPAPVNRVLNDVLSALTAGREPRSAWRGQPQRLLERLDPARGI